MIYEFGFDSPVLGHTFKEIVDFISGFAEMDRTYCHAKLAVSGFDVNSDLDEIEESLSYVKGVSSSIEVKDDDGDIVDFIQRWSLYLIFEKVGGPPYDLEHEFAIHGRDDWVIRTEAHNLNISRLCLDCHGNPTDLVHREINAVFLRYQEIVAHIDSPALWTTSRYALLLKCLECSHLDIVDADMVPVRFGECRSLDELVGRLRCQKCNALGRAHIFPQIRESINLAI